MSIRVAVVGVPFVLKLYKHVFRRQGFVCNRINLSVVAMVSSVKIGLFVVLPANSVIWALRPKRNRNRTHITPFCQFFIRLKLPLDKILIPSHSFIIFYSEALFFSRLPQF